MSGTAAIAQLPAPVAHWTFDEGIDNFNLTTAPDSSGNANDGVWQDVVDDATVDLGYTAGQIGGAARFQGQENGFFTVAEIPQLNGIVPAPLDTLPVLGVGVTFSAWIKLDEDASIDNTGILIGREVTDIVDVNGMDVTQENQMWGLLIHDTNPQNLHAQSRVSTDFINSTQSNEDPDNIFLGQWQHVAMVWGNADSAGTPVQRIYIDGVLVADRNLNVWELVSNGSWSIGNDTCCEGRVLDGLLDDLAVFDMAFSTDDIEELYNDGLAGTDAAGNATGQLLAGDVNGVDGVTIDDFSIILNALGRDASARNQGDLNGDRRVDLDDFQEWLENSPAAARTEALEIMAGISVPEPSCCILLGLSLLMGPVRTRASRLTS